MALWSKPYKIRRSTQILSFAVNQNFEGLSTMGEECFLLCRMRRSNETFQLANRRVTTISKMASGYTTDPDTGFIRYRLWGESSDLITEYPDSVTLTCTVQASGGVTQIWEPAVDKYSFIAGRTEYAFDIYQNQLNAAGDEIEDAVYVVFNTPPMNLYFTSIFNFGTINPMANFDADQPVHERQDGFYNSLFGYNQWLSSTSTIRGNLRPNTFLLAFPGVMTDFSITEGGLLRESKSDYWTTPPPYSPEVQEHDVVVRKSTEQRFQVINRTPIYIEDILVSQHFDLAELDPRSTAYSVEISEG